MPRNVIISKENILNAGFDITRKYDLYITNLKIQMNFLMNYVRKSMIIFIHIS